MVGDISYFINLVWMTMKQQFKNKNNVRLRDKKKSSFCMKNRILDPLNQNPDLKWTLNGPM